MLEITEDSHVDHGLTPAMLEHIKRRFADREEFFIQTIELPAKDDGSPAYLGDVECALVGPALGFDPITDEDEIVNYVVRPGRKWASRVVEWGRKERTLLVTVIAGPHGDRPCVLYTAYGGPLAPREPGDPAIASWDELEASRRFWSEHALVAD